MKRLISITLLLTLSILCTGKNKLRVTVLESTPDTLTPGIAAIVGLKLWNESDSTLMLCPKITLPNGWTLLSDNKLIELLPGSNLVYACLLKPAGTVHPGIHDLTFKFTDCKSQTTLSQTTIQVLVKTTIGFTFELIDLPIYLRHGDTLRCKVFIQNNGNTTQRCSIKCKGFEVSPSDQIEIAASSSVYLTLKKKIDTRITSSNQLPILAELFTHASEKRAASAFGWIQLINSDYKTKDQYFRFPISGSVSLISKSHSSNNKTIPTLDLEGGGSLDTAGRHYLALELHTPRHPELLYLGSEESYSVSYSSKRISLTAGDQYFEQTPLLESGRNSRGIAFTTMFRGLQITAFRNTPKHYPAIKWQTGLSMNYQRNKNEFSVAYQRKESPHDSISSHLASVGYKTKYANLFSTELELSSSINNRQLAGYGLRFESGVEWQKANIALHVIKASKDFTGYYNNSLHYTIQSSYNITSRLTIGASTNRYEQNVALDTNLRSAPLQKGWFGSMGYTIGKSVIVKLIAGRTEKEDQFKSQKFHFSNSYVRAYLTWTKMRWSLAASLEHGLSKNHQIKDTLSEAASWGSQINGSYQLNKNLALSGFVSYSKNNHFSSQITSSIYYGGQIKATILKKLQLVAEARNSYAPDEMYHYRNTTSMELKYHFNKSHSLSFSLKELYRDRSSEKNEIFGWFTYQFSVGVPMKRIQKNGSVRGIITGVSRELTEGIVIMMDGKSAIVNKEGEFIFEEVSPGRHFCLFDPKSHKNALIITGNTQPQVEVLPDRINSVTIGMSEAAALIFRHKSNLDLSGAPCRFVIVLKNEEKTIRVMANETGITHINNLSPGRWKIEIIKPFDLKEYEFEVVNEVSLRPNEERALDIEFNPRKKKVHFENQSITIAVKNDI